MSFEKQNSTEEPGQLARRITDALLQERVVPRFVDSYVVENGRHALQVHASLYRDLLTLLQREALLELTVRALAIVCDEPQAAAHAAAGRHGLSQKISGIAGAAAGLDCRRGAGFSAGPADLRGIAGARGGETAHA